MSFEMNKIAGAVLAAMILAMVSGIIANILVHPKPLEKPVYVVAGAEPAQKPAEAGQQAGPEPIASLLATANADAGKAATKVCNACHTFEKGGPNRIGPNLYNLVDEPIAEGRSDYPFSPALSAHKSETWTVDNLNKWLWNPKTFANGTKMTYAGMPKAKDRADVVAYLNSLSDNPKPLTANK